MEDIKKEKRTKEPKAETGAWLSFYPIMDIDEFGDEYVEKLKIYLSNQTSCAYKFVYKLNYFNETEFDLKNEVQPFENFYLHDIAFEDVNDGPSFEFDFSPENAQKNKADHYESIIKTRPKQVFNRIEELKQKNEPSFSYLLFERYPDKILEEKPFALDKLANKGFKIYSAKEARQHLEPARSVVDLHIEKLTDNYSRMSNFEMLSLQLKNFEKYYNLAVAHLLPNLIIIHGVGTGKLRDEIHDALRLKKEVSSFINQYDPRYGYGATEIFFKH